MSAVPTVGGTDQGAYTQELSRSLSLGGNILITLSAVTPASSVFIIIPSVLAAVGGASFVAFLAASFVGIFMAFGLDPVPWTPRKRGCSSWDVHVGGSLLSTKTKP